MKKTTLHESIYGQDDSIFNEYCRFLSDKFKKEHEELYFTPINIESHDFYNKKCINYIGFFNKPIKPIDLSNFL